MRVEVRPELLDWARERAGLSVDAIVQRLPKFEQWGRQKAQPTLRQLEQFASLTHTPIGYLFLPTPPVETLPIPDFRTVADTGVVRPLGLTSPSVAGWRPGRTRCASSSSKPRTWACWSWSMASSATTTGEN